MALSRDDVWEAFLRSKNMTDDDEVDDEDQFNADWEQYLLNSGPGPATPAATPSQPTWKPATPAPDPGYSIITDIAVAKTLSPQARPLMLAKWNGHSLPQPGMFITKAQWNTAKTLPARYYGYGDGTALCVGPGQGATWVPRGMAK